MNPSLEALLLVAALCLDTLVSGFSLGMNGIRVPFSSAAIVSGVCSAILAASLYLGGALKTILPAGTARLLSFFILFLLGLTRLLDSLIKQFILTRRNGQANLKFHFLSLQFILHIYADSVEADVNHSKTISAGEAASLAIALSLDGLVAGVGAGITNASYLEMIGYSVCLNLLAVLLGCLIGKRLAAKSKADLSWIGGVVLLGLAVSKLI